jgi:tRNA A-37 threonylcarbamoyl transferase component Bud32/tetratricopeptide (TPR) repeat protein
MEDEAAESTATVADALPEEQARRRPSRPSVRPIGTMLGRYIMLSEIGQGGMSTVHIAYDPQLDRRVALKVVRKDRLSEGFRARLHREAQALARLSHPNVVTVFDVGDIRDQTFVAMELVDGQSLKDWGEKPHPWREVLRVMVAAGRGLAAAHAAGIVHRDVKPHNIVLGKNGEVKLVDFGLARDVGERTSQPEIASDSYPSLDESSGSFSDSGAKHLETITEAGHVVGTPAYMPPEQHSKRPEADERSDQFSFCVTLYEALYKQRPYQKSRRELFDRDHQLTVADRPTTEPRTLAVPPPTNTDVPAWVRKVVMRGLAVEPRFRYPSVDALLEDLDRDPARTRRLVALAGAAVVAVAGIAALATWKMAQHPEAAPLCSDGADRVAAVWNPTFRDDIAHAAAKLKLGWTDGAVAAFESGIDRWADTWKAMHLDACRATRERGEQSQEALDLRMTCLDRRLGDVAALVAVMREADAGALRNAGDAVANLSPITECADVSALRRVTKPPSDPAAVRRIEAVDDKVARLAALYAVGDKTKTLELADRVIPEAREVGFAPTLARALYWRGRAVADGGGGPDAEVAFDEVFTAAIGAGDDKLAADASARVAQEELWTAHVPEFQRWSRIAHALADRVGATDLTLWIDQLDCMSNHWAGKVMTRLSCLRGVAARRDKAGLPSEWLWTTLGTAAAEAGDFSGAISWLERGVQMSTEENGADHPRTLELRGYLCHGLNEQGDYARASRECTEALDKLQRVAPTDKLLIARVEEYLGDAEAELGHEAHARELLEAARTNGDEEIQGDAAATLGALAGSHGDSAKSIAEQRTALAETIKIYEPFSPHHPNIIAARHELGSALLDAGRISDAATELAKADDEVDPEQISPLELAQLRFARAQAVAKLPHPDLELAHRLATSARDLYVQHAPDTEGFRKRRTEIDTFLAARR